MRGTRVRLSRGSCSVTRSNSSCELKSMMIWPRSGVLTRIRTGVPKRAWRCCSSSRKWGGLPPVGGRAGVGRVLADAGAGRGRLAGGDEGLGLADREALGDDPLAGAALGVVVGQAEQGTGVPWLIFLDRTASGPRRAGRAGGSGSRRSSGRGRAGRRALPGCRRSGRGSRGTPWPSRARSGPRAGGSRPSPAR